MFLVKKHLFDKWGTFKDLTRDCTPEWRWRLSRRLLGDNGANQMGKHDEAAENLHAGLLLPFALIKLELSCLFRLFCCLLLDVSVCCVTFPFPAGGSQCQAGKQHG